jgi:hypothetical protein
MLSDSELNKLNEFSDKYDKFKSFMGGGGNGENGSSESGTPDINSGKDAFGKLLNPDMASLSPDQMVSNIVGGLASSVSGMGSLNIGVKNTNIKDKKNSNGIIKDLIGLVKGIIQMPMRFGNMFKGLMLGTGALGLGIGGITKSVALGTKDLYLLFVAVMTIIFKYYACILSFTISTIGGCLFLHFITLCFMMVYIGIMYIVDSINDMFGVDFSSIVDEIFEQIKWPSTIQLFCYTCFGKPVKLRDILADVGAIENVGNMISYDFNNKMPRYMKPAIPLGTSALKSIDKAIN